MSLVQIAGNQEQPVATRPLCLQDLLTRQAAETPDVLAVVEGQDALTYHALETRANQLAHVLRDLGVKPEMVVGLALQPGRDQLQALVALIAIFKAGGAVLNLLSVFLH